MNRYFLNLAHNHLVNIVDFYCFFTLASIGSESEQVLMTFSSISRWFATAHATIQCIWYVTRLLVSSFHYLTFLCTSCFLFSLPHLFVYFLFPLFITSPFCVLLVSSFHYLTFLCTSYFLFSLPHLFVYFLFPLFITSPFCVLLISSFHYLTFLCTSCFLFSLPHLFVYFLFPLFITSPFCVLLVSSFHYLTFLCTSYFLFSLPHLFLYFLFPRFITSPFCLLVSSYLSFDYAASVCRIRSISSIKLISRVFVSG